MQNGTRRSFRTGQNRGRSRLNWSSFGGLTSRNTANDLANAKRSHDRYMALARAAMLAGDTIEAENCYMCAPLASARARCAARSTSSNLFGTLSTQSSTVTRAIWGFLHRERVPLRSHRPVCRFEVNEYCAAGSDQRRTKETVRLKYYAPRMTDKVILRGPDFLLQVNRT